MMENRSFDHYLGWMPNADGRQAGVTLPRRRRESRRATHRLTPEYQGCGHPDPGHGWDSGRVQFNNGQARRLAEGGQQNRRVRAWLLREGRPRLHPGRHRRGDDVRPLLLLDPRARPTRTASTCGRPSRTATRRTTCRSTRRASPTRPRSSPRSSARAAPSAPTSTTCPRPRSGGQDGFAAREPRRGLLHRLRERHAAERRFVDPPFKDGGGGDGMSADEHPHGDVRLGQAYMSDVVHAFMESPQWERGAIFVVYDEWGGFFDHVRPPRVPDVRNSRKLDEDFGQMGFRIPALVLSPYARRGHVDHGTYGFESIIKLLRYRFAAKAADAARPVRAQHRVRLRLAGQAAPRAAGASGPGERGDGHLHGARARLPPARAAPQPPAPARAVRGRRGAPEAARLRAARDHRLPGPPWRSPTTHPTRRRCSASPRR